MNYTSVESNKTSGPTSGASDFSNVPNVADVVDVTHLYGKTLALDDVSVSIPAGKMVGLIGPDGVGKSTLLGLLSGARKLQTGSVSVLDGSMASAKHRQHVCSRIAYLPQGLGKNLYQELSVQENLDFFGKLFGQSAAERKTRILRLATATGLDPFLDRPAEKLSGGMKQKLGLCCALIHDPDFLILDEPTTGVDPLSRRQFWELIDSIRAERPTMSVLVSTAYMDEAERFEWLIAMDAGHILATATPDELKSKTKTDNLEQAFVALLPEQKRGKGKLIIPPRPEVEAEPAIIAKGLTRRFGNFTAVDHVSFTIQKGEIFGFLGSNGCGKTTTMKMLTGLLPPSEGEAWLWGKSVDANDMATRYRVGFMSQAFSLYTELTVAQNLTLHARLFHIPRAKAKQRIDELVARFGLKPHLNSRASALPLGLRQRLSLAVAIIHEPEMLILDEPTSGVDPVARDEFWELLIDLSRNKLVTIFISTHFMNEALRCDRISLMHSGKVLVYDTPQKIIESKNAATLEEAFIHYIEEAAGDSLEESAEGKDRASSSEKPLSLSVDSSSAKDSKPAHLRSKLGSSLQRLFAYSYREMMEVMRDPVRLTFAFVGSLILLLIVTNGLSSDVENLSYAVLDQDQTPASRAYLQEFSSSRYFTQKRELYSKDDLENRLASRDITMAIEIPPNFGRELKRNGKPQVSAWIDGAETARAATIEGYVEGAHASFLRRFSRENGMSVTTFASMEVRNRYNPTSESIYAMGPSVPTMLLLLFPAILMAVSVAREKEIGTITNFYVTPTSRLEFLLGKQLPYIGIAMVNFVILNLVVVFLLQVPLKGSLLALVLGGFLYVTATTGYGLLVSNLTSSQVSAVLLAAVLSMMPTIQFSGMMQPVSTLEGGARVMGSLWPASYYLHLSVGAFTKGLGMKELLPDLLKLAAFSPVFWILCTLLLRKQED